MTVRVRIAVGGDTVCDARIAVLAWLFTRSQAGHIVVRFKGSDDTSAYAIEKNFTRLGLPWDETIKGLSRPDAYEAARDALIAKQLLYPCHDSENGGSPQWRFRLSGRRVLWRDLIRGEQSVNTAWLPDPVLVGADGVCRGPLTSVVDDIATGITHTVCGEDHVVRTGIQVELFQALGAAPPCFTHVPKLYVSQRLNMRGVAALIEDGVEPKALVSYLATLGACVPVGSQIEWPTPAAGFSIKAISCAPARFAEEDLKRVNGAFLRAMPYAEVKARLAAMGADMGEAFWNAVRGNIMRVDDAKTWAAIIEGPISPVIADRTFADAALSVLPVGAYDATRWRAFTDAVHAKTGAIGRALFMPLRLALTGLDHGPEMGALFALIGEEKARERLGGVMDQRR